MAVSLRDSGVLLSMVAQRRKECNEEWFAAAKTKNRATLRLRGFLAEKEGFELFSVGKNGTFGPRKLQILRKTA